MTNAIIKTITIFCVWAVITSCDKPECENSNPVFDKYFPETREYKNELINRLKRVDRSKLSYVLDKYEEEDSSQYLHVFIRGDGLCAKGVILVNNWDDKLEGIRKAKGIGYSGAELVNLRFDIHQDSARTEFIYQSIDAVID
jgi:hypothetical protein